jgi:hypothetical protein
MVMKLEHRSSGSRGDRDLAAGNNDWPVAVGDAWERRTVSPDYLEKLENVNYGPNALRR